MPSAIWPETRCSRASAGKLAEATAGHGRCYRLGGDEFCLLAPADATLAGRLLDDSLDALGEQGEGFAVTSSFGAVLLPEHASDGIGALREADERLYVQKRGRERDARRAPRGPPPGALRARAGASHPQLTASRSSPSPSGTR